MVVVKVAVALFLLSSLLLVGCATNPADEANKTTGNQVGTEPIKEQEETPVGEMTVAEDVLTYCFNEAKPDGTCTTVRDYELGPEEVIIRKDVVASKLGIPLSQLCIRLDVPPHAKDLFEGADVSSKEIKHTSHNKGFMKDLSVRVLDIGDPTCCQGSDCYTIILRMKDYEVVPSVKELWTLNSSEYCGKKRVEVFGSKGNKLFATLCDKTRIVSLDMNTGDVEWEFNRTTKNAHLGGDYILATSSTKSGKHSSGSFVVHVLDPETGETIFEKNVEDYCDGDFCDISKVSHGIADELLLILDDYTSSEVHKKDHLVIGVNLSTGKELWRFEQRTHEKLPPIVYDDEASFIVFDDTLKAVDRKSGEVKWERTLEGINMDHFFYVAPKVIQMGENVFASFKTGALEDDLYAFSKDDGSVVWRNENASGDLICKTNDSLFLGSLFLDWWYITKVDPKTGASVSWRSYMSSHNRKCVSLENSLLLLESTELMAFDTDTLNQTWKYEISLPYSKENRWFISEAGKNKWYLFYYDDEGIYAKELYLV
ncbi:MAG: PQQ-binding-like beta-propeller repeat protein [Candidatus Diapherotrites archaeon]|nr:PQQ-binding-like beta-propeller repeat protein [Candidatus Diapherotrites archaeon]